MQGIIHSTTQNEDSSQLQNKASTQVQNEDSLQKINFLRKMSNATAVLLAFCLPISTTLTYVMLIVTIVTWFLSGAPKTQFKMIANHPLTKAAYCLFIVFLVGAIYSEASTPNIVKSLNQMGKLIFLPFLIPIYQNKVVRRYTMIAFIAAMTLTLCLSLFKVYGEYHIMPSNWARYSRASVFKNHIDTNLMMAFAAYIMGYFTLNEANIRKKVLYFCLTAAMMFYVMALSEGRVGQIIFIVLALMLFQRVGLKALLYAAIVLTISISVIGSHSSVFQDRWTQINNSLQAYIKEGKVNTSLGQRIEYTQETFNLAKQKPFFGFGTGSFNEVYGQHAKANNLQVTTNPHNEYLNIFLQVGLLGLFAFFRLLFVLLRYSFVLPPLEKTIAQGVFVALALGSVANSWIMDFTSGYFFILMSALSFSAISTKAKYV